MDFWYMVGRCPRGRSISTGMAIRIRSATQLDILPVFKLCVAMHEETDFRHFKLNPEKMVRNISGWIADPDHHTEVAERDGEVIGLMFAHRRETWFSDEDVAAEHLFYVRPDCRGSRAALLLIEGFMRWKEAADLKHGHAGVGTGTGDAAERLYQHVGMYRVGGNYVIHGGSHVLRR